MIHLIKGEQVEFTTLLEENQRLLAEDLVTATGEELLGITRLAGDRKLYIRSLFPGDYRVSTEAGSHWEARLPGVA